MCTSYTVHIIVHCVYTHTHISSHTQAHTQTYRKYNKDMFTILDVYFINKTFQIGMNFRIRIKTFSLSFTYIHILEVPANFTIQIKETRPKDMK